MSRAAPRYIAILAALMNGPATTGQVQASIGASQVVNLRLNLRMMHRHGLVHVAGWLPPRRPDGGGLPAVIWARGAGADAPPIKGTKPPKPYAAVSTEMIAFAGLVLALERGPLTCAELAIESGYALGTVWALLRQMRSAGVVRIGAWDCTTHTPAAAYALGPGKSAPKPAPEAKRAVELRYYAKKMARAEQQRMLRALSANASVFNLAQSA